MVHTASWVIRCYLPPCTRTKEIHWTRTNSTFFGGMKFLSPRGCEQNSCLNTNRKVLYLLSARQGKPVLSTPPVQDFRKPSLLLRMTPDPPLIPCRLNHHPKNDGDAPAQQIEMMSNEAKRPLQWRGLTIRCCTGLQDWASQLKIVSCKMPSFNESGSTKKYVYI